MAPGSRTASAVAAALVVLVGCGAPPQHEQADAGSTLPGDAGLPPGHWYDECGHERPDVFLDAIVSFTPGSYAGFGQEKMPCVALGPPQGGGDMQGSLDVVSLGDDGTIIGRFDDVEIVDGPGPDLIVFENPFEGWVEPGFVAVSEDGENWTEWPCQPENADAGYPLCAGIHPVYSKPGNGIDPSDPSKAGGDAFDLADIGVKQARYVRIRDSGFSHYGGNSGGFDLDAVSAVNRVSRVDGGSAATP